MIVDLKSFPLSGSSICAALKMVAPVNQIWCLNAIETLAEPPAFALGELWRRIQAEKMIFLSSGELCEALVMATQVIALDLVLQADSNVYLIVEDGLVVECSFN